MSKDQTPSPPITGEWQRQAHRQTIQRSAAQCYALFCDFERTPEWLVELRSARVRSYDAAGRPAVVDYMAAQVRGGYVYPMHYEYDAEGLAVSWKGVVKGGVRHIEGAVRFTPQGADACEMIYETAIGLSAELPAWFRSSQQDRPVEQMCQAFKRWAEGTE